MPELTNEAHKQIKANESMWLKLSEGDNLLRVMSKIHYSYKHNYLDKKGQHKSSVCPVMTTPDSDPKCPICEMIRSGELGDSAKEQIRYCCFVVDRNTETASLLESGKSIFDELYNLIQQGWDLSKNDVVITRKGTGLSTEYKVAVKPKSDPLKDTEKQSVEKLAKEVDLDKYTTPDTYENIVKKYNGEEINYDEIQKKEDKEDKKKDKVDIEDVNF